MGISLWLILRNGIQTARERQSVVLFSLQMGFNLLWSLVFFGGHSIGGGLIVIVILLLLVGATIYAFYGVSKPAVWLLVPYELWVCFATVLNTLIFLLN
jgi:tryptophan-rich sensory protein